jgi:hypothetical protein
MRLAASCGIAVAGLALALNGQGAAQAATATQAMTVAQAATAGTVGPAGTTSGNGSVGSGNQLILPITVPIDICGNVVAALGLGQAQCTGGSTVASGAQGKGTGRTDQAAMSGWSGTQMAGSQAAARTSGNGGVLSGNQILVPVTVPVTVCGVAVAVLGTASGNCQSTPCHCHRASHLASRPKPQPTHVRQSAPAPHPEAAIHPEAIPEAGILPITGVNLAGMTGGAVILLAAGGGTLLAARRRH